MDIGLVLTAFIASFVLTHVQPRHLEDKEAVASDGKIHDNFRRFFDSITNNEWKNTKTYRNILEQETANERAAFDTMKEELQLTRQKNAHVQRNLNNGDGDIAPSKRETPDSDQGSEKHEGGCNGHNDGHDHGDKDTGKCCMDDNNKDNQGGCCQDENNQGGCCQDEDGGGHAGGCCQADDDDDYDYGDGVAGDGCGRGTNPNWDGLITRDHYDRPSRYHKRSVQPDGQVIGWHDEEMIGNSRESSFMDTVKEADANTLLYFSTMLTKLRSYVQALIFQMDVITRDLHLEYPKFGNWTPHAVKVIDDALAVIKNREQEVEREQDH